MQSLNNLHQGKTDTIYLKLWLQLAKSAKNLEQEMETRFQQRFRQSFSRFDLLSQLYRYAPEWLPMGRLAGQLIASRGNITRLVDRMIAEGLIARRPDPEDRRIIQVGLTRKGRALFKRMAKAHAEWAGAMLADLGKQNSRHLLKLLVQVNQDLKDGRVRE